MELISYNGVLFSSLASVGAPLLDNTSQPGPDRMVQLQSRIGADPLPGGVLVGGQTLPLEFIADDTPEASLNAVFAALNLDDPTEKTLVAQLLDGTFIETQAVVGSYRRPDINSLAVDLVLVTPGWRAQSTTNLKTLAADVTNGNFANSNTGYRDMLPIITTYWPASTQRSSSTSTFGWTRRLGPLVITNNGTEPLINQPYQIGPVNHSALVGAGALASGDDFRIFCEGVELARNLIGANSHTMFAWVILPTVAPGQSITLDIIWRNTSAGSPPTLTFSSTPMRPGMDISGTAFTGGTAASVPTITKAGAGWETNQWAGGTVIVTDSGGVMKWMQRIVSNTATVLTLDQPVVVGATDEVTVIKSGMRATGSTGTSSTTTSITSPAFVNANEWIGATIWFLSGAQVNQRRTITSNTTGAFTFTPALSGAPGNVVYVVYQSNGARMWDVRTPPKTTNYPGLWQANKIQAPPTQVSFDAPGSWYRFTYQASSDEYSQPRYDSFLVGAGDYDHVPIMNIQRARRGKVGSQREVGIADAIGVATPFPINGVTFGYTLRNAKKAGVAEGMCEARFMTQEAGGELWSTFLSDVAVRNSTQTVVLAYYDLTSYGNPNRIAMTLVPNGQDEISTADNNTAQLRSTGDYVRLSVNPASVITESIDWVASPPTITTAIYDYSLIMRTGGASATKPYYQVVIGGTDHRVFVTGTDERIVVDCEKHTATLQTAAGAVVRRIPWAVQVQKIVADPVDGSTETLVADRWLPIPPNMVDSNAIYFSDPSGAGWGSINIGVTGRKGFRT